MSTPAVVREFDPLSTGHGCVGTTTLDTPIQSTVYANGILVAVKGTPTVAHPFPPDPPCAPHVAQLNLGSNTVFVEGIELGRVGDSADAGQMTNGSPNVFAGP